MNILLVTTSYPDDNDGAAAAGVFVRDFAHTLAGLGTKITVVAPGTLTRTTGDSAVHVQRFAVPRQPLSLLKPYKPQDWPAISQTMRSGRQAVNRACVENRIDHILALWALPSGAWAQNAAKKHGIPYSTWALGSDIWTLGRLPITRQWLRLVLRNAAQRYADGLQLGKDVSHISGMDCEFLPSTRQLPLRTTPQPPRSVPPFRLAFLGRWHPNKGIDLLLDALHRLDENDWSRIEQVRIFGGGPMNERVHSLSHTLRQHGRPLETGGYLNPQEAAELLAWSDFVLIPSRIESIPVIFSDAMQANRPVIAMPVGDLPELIARHPCGILSKAVTADDYAQAIKTALHQAPKHSVDGIRNARQVFDIQQSAARLISDIRGATP